MNLSLHENMLQVRRLDCLSATNCTAFRNDVRSKIDATHPIVEVDCSDVRFIDSEGLGALVSIHRTALQHQGKIRLVHPTPLVRKLIELIHFDEIFEVAP